MKLKHLVRCVVLFGACLILQGCAVFYYSNELQTIQEAPLDKVWAAVQATSSELQFTTDPKRSSKDGLRAILFARNAQGQQIIIQLFRQSDRLTDIRVSVGVCNTGANRQSGQVVYDKICSKL
jgi:hypothetical protein